MSIPGEQPQILLILVGLPGSGKTTFAEALVNLQSDHSPIDGSTPTRRRKWIRASQDDAPNRRRQECEAIVRKGLREGHNVVVDRVGFDAVQRSHFIQIGRQQRSPPKIYCLILETSRHTLTSRLTLRPSHPTLPDPETALRVLRQMERSYQPPRNGGEGFDRILALTEQEQGDGHWNQEQVENILDRIELEGVEDRLRDREWRNAGNVVQSSGNGGSQWPRSSAARGGYRGALRGQNGYQSSRGHGDDRLRYPSERAYGSNEYPQPTAYAPDIRNQHGNQPQPVMSRDSQQPPNIFGQNMGNRRTPGPTQGDRFSQPSEWSVPTTTSHPKSAGPTNQP